MQTLKHQTGRYSTLQWSLGVVALALLGTFYAIGIRPAQTKHAATLNTTNSKRQLLAAAEKDALRLPEVTRKVAELENRLAKFDKKLPKKPDMDQFMREITHVSEQSSLKKMTVQVGAPKRDDRLSEMPIALNFTGDFESVVSFLKQTEEMQRLTRVRNLLIRTRDPREGTVEVDVALNIYFAD